MHCACGSLLPEQFGSGRRRTRCEPCAKEKRNERKVHEHVCAGCGEKFQNKRGQTKYCSPKCWPRKTPSTAEFVAKQRAAGRSFKWDFNCEHCGKLSNGRPPAHLRGTGARKKFCSKDCANESRRLAHQPQFTAVHENSCKCGRKWFARKVVDFCAECAPLAKRASLSKTKQCANCKVDFTALNPNAGRDICSDQCRREIAKRAHKVYVKRARQKRGGNKWPQVCRKFGAAYEPINVLSVFERDGWTCQICAKPTPRSARGKYEHFAPELDHRFPVSRKGSHSYRNTQCLCRECNGRKVNHLLQLGPLFVRQPGARLFQ